MYPTFTDCTIRKSQGRYELIPQVADVPISYSSIARAIAFALQREGKLAVSSKMSPPPRQRPYKVVRAALNHSIIVDGFHYHIHLVHSAPNENDAITIRSDDGRFEHKISVAFLKIEDNL